MKKINITITGALGRMGQVLVNRISKNKSLHLRSLTDVKVGKKIKGIKIQNNNLTKNYYEMELNHVLKY